MGVKKKGGEIFRIMSFKGDVRATTIDSSNWMMLCDANELKRFYEENGTITITFNPPIVCKIDTSSRPADATAVRVRPIAKKPREKKRGAVL